MPGGVLTESQIAIDHRRVDRRHLRRAQASPAEQPVDRAGADGREEAALRGGYAVESAIWSRRRGAAPAKDLGANSVEVFVSR